MGSLFTGRYMSAQNHGSRWLGVIMGVTFETSQPSMVELNIEKSEEHWLIWTRSQDWEALNQGICIQEGVFQPFHKFQVSMRRENAHSLNVWAENEISGQFHCHLDFSPGGMRLKIIHQPTQAVHCEFWTRKLSLDGWYRLDRGTIMEDEPKRYSSPRESCALKKHFWIIGSIMRVQDGNETRPEATVVTEFHLDEKINEHSHKSSSSTQLKVAQVGPSRFTTVSKGSQGERKEWITSFHESGMILDGRDLNSGQTVRSWWQKTPDFVGTFVLRATVGWEQYAKAIGMEPSLMQRIQSEIGSRWSMNMQCGWLQIQSGCSILPVEQGSLKSGVEFLMTQSGFLGTFRALMVIQGPSLTITCQNQGGLTIIQELKFGPNFALMRTRVAASRLCFKAIFERC